MNKLREFRYYQTEADAAIHEELIIANKCIVKMFCGTGKSLLMRKMKSVQNQKLVVYVFPSLSLIDQFCTDYFTKVGLPCPFKISSAKDYKDEDGNTNKNTSSTTDPAIIRAELQRESNKFICVTYQSYNTLLENLGSIKIDVCIYDEAHHAVGETYQKLIFEQEESVVKQIFFTATPKDDNGIVMCNKESGICGRTIYDYSYLRGLEDGYLNPFEIRVDMYTENTNKSVYESIARAVLVSGNNRVLTFHADVSEKSESMTSVRNFVKENDFIRAFTKVLTNEFPEKAGLYTKFKMIALDACIPMNERRTILDKFDTTSDNEIYIISSCETIGEGIDTKNANMCVFVDPKSSFVKIIQNIGRIVRPQSKPSTVLIPCWVEREKYIGCEDSVKRDEVIRSDLNKDGNFNGILNVLSALRQEDEDLYDMCLNYGENVDDKSNYSSSRDYSDSDDYDSDNYDSQDEIETKTKHKINISFHTNDDIKVLWKILSDIDIMKNMYSCVLECEVVKYDPMDVAVAIIERAKEREGNGGKLLPRNIEKKRRNTLELIQETRDAQKLGEWKKTRNDGNLEDVKKYLDDNLTGWRISIDEQSLSEVKAIVERANERVKCGGRLLPKQYNVKNRITVQLIQESKDSNKLSNLARALNGSKNSRCSIIVRDYLNINMPGWSDNFDSIAYKTAIQIVTRAKQRLQNGINLFPIRYTDANDKLTEMQIQEKYDANKLQIWKMVVNNSSNIKSIYLCPENVKDYLDIQLPGWRTENNLEEIALNFAYGIVERAKKREQNGEHLFPKAREKKKRTSEDLEQEHKDFNKLGMWRDAIKGKGSCIKYESVINYLNLNLPGWHFDLDDKAMECCILLVKRAEIRQQNGEKLIPRTLDKKRVTNPILEQEYKDAIKLNHLKSALKNSKIGRCPDEVRDYLDKKLPGWRDDNDLKQNAIELAYNIVERAKKRLANGGKLIPYEIRIASKRNTEELEQIHKDASKISNWKQALKCNGKQICYPEVRDYLDEHLKGWRTTDDTSVEESNINLVIEEEIVITPKPKKSMKLKESTTKEPKETIEQKKQRTKSELEVLHQRYKTLTSQNLQKEFQETPELWHQYHAISEENEKSFPEESIPRNRIIQELTEIKTKRTRSVVDMGCGRAQIAEHFANDTRFSFINYDHVSCKENVLVQDISQTPLEDHSVEICILCLAMWGSNCHDYVREAYRILESGGKLYIMEATKRWTSVATESVATESVTESLVEGGPPADKLKTLLEETGFQIDSKKSSVEKFSLFVCTK